MRLVDLTGKKFGKLTVIARSGNDKRGRARWLCACDCGRSKVAASYLLQHGDTSSCGCGRSEAMKKAAAIRWDGNVFAEHKDKYQLWRNMVSRCHNPADKQFKWYGAKGVFVCDEWRTFAGFVAWAKDRPPSMTLDRINPDGPYQPDNCRWVDHLIQQNNRRKHVWIEYEGERMTATQLARKLGVSCWKIYNGIKDKNDPLGYVR